MLNRPWVILLGACPAAVLIAYFVFAGLLSGFVSDRAVMVYLVLYAVAGVLALVSVVAVWLQRVHIVARILHTLAGIAFAVGMYMWIAARFVVTSAIIAFANFPLPWFPLGAAPNTPAGLLHV